MRCLTFAFAVLFSAQAFGYGSAGASRDLRRDAAYRCGDCSCQLYTPYEQKRCSYPIYKDGKLDLQSTVHETIKQCIEARGRDYYCTGQRPF